ncbi:MAG: DNA topoisomerase I subunit omega, partial [Congregibacter sp.]|nr:DNA topoisomerase I subunit omega [Congregibacter sp.]
PKYTFLFEAPVQDNDGNLAQVRYSRKTKEQYVMTEEDGKATGWKAFYDGGRWQVEAPPKRKPKAKAKTKAKAKAKTKTKTKAKAKAKATPKASEAS